MSVSVAVVAVVDGVLSAKVGEREVTLVEMTYGKWRLVVGAVGSAVYDDGW